MIDSFYIAQVEEDIKQGTSTLPIAPSDAGKEEVIASVVANVSEMIRADRKITALKQLQARKLLVTITSLIVSLENLL